jgi:diaminopimelate epimerase
VPGGDLTITLEAGLAWLTGPAVIVAEGELDPAWLAGHLAGADAPASR